MITSSRKYGLKASIVSICWGFLVISPFIIVGFSSHFLLGLLVIAIYYVALANYLAVIYIEGNSVVINELFNPFVGNRVFPIGDIEKVLIKPDTFLGRTSYDFHFTDGRSWSTFHKLLKSERNQLVKELEARGLQGDSV